MKLSTQIRLTTIVTACALIGLADPVHATGNHTPKEPPSKPAPTPAPPAPTSVYVGGSPAATSTSGAGAQSGSAADASAGSRSDSQSTASGGQATGGAGGTSNAALSDSGNATSGSNLTDSSSFWSQSRALGLTFAPGAFTPPMAPVACASATITQSARGLGMGLLSRADSKTDSSDCTLINLRNAMVAACKFESAKQVEDLLVKKHLPDFKPSEVTYLRDKNDPGMVDYSPTQCALLTNPPPAPKEPVTLNWIYVPPPVARVEDKPTEPIVPPDKPKKPNPAKAISTKPPAPKGGGTTLNCGDVGVPLCVAKPKKPLALGGAGEGRS